MDKEQPKKRKISDKLSKKLKVAKVSTDESKPPLPPTPNTDSAPPLPEDSCLPLMLSSTHQNESGDGEMDMNSFLTDHDIPATDGDVVLPTVPSLSDLMCQSDICGSIASSNSSPAPEGECPLFKQCNGETTTDTDAIDAEIKQEVETDLMDSSTCGANPAQVKDTAESNEDGITDNAAESAELVEHAHALLDSTSNVKLEPQDEDGVANKDGYVLRTRQLVRDIVPNSQYEVLPEGWKELTHSSGLSIYCHLPTRVVTWARPYFLGDRYAKTHDVPVGAIPCMVYRKCKQLFNKQGAKNETSTVCNGQSTSNDTASKDESSTLGGEQTEPIVNGVTIKTEPQEVQDGVENSAESTTPPFHKFPPLTNEMLREYCLPVFDFEVKEIKQFTSWKQRKEHEKKIKVNNKLSAASKQGASRIVIPVTELPAEYQRDDRGKLKRDFIVIYGTQTVVDIFHHYVNWMFKKPPVVELKPVDAGFQCSMRSKHQQSIMGIGIGVTKKSAKEKAATCALQVLTPKYADQLIKNALCYGDKEKTQEGLEEYYKIFDSMSIKDQRVVEMSKDTNQSYPFVILKSCLARNFAYTENDIKVTTSMERHSGRTAILCDMSVGPFSTTGAKGKNTKMAMHAAAQNLLQQLHPNLTSWGSILRLYGKFSDGSSEDQQHKLAHQTEVTGLQTISNADGKVKANPLDEVSDVVLKKLRKQMSRLFKLKNDKGVQMAKKKFGHEVAEAVVGDGTSISNNDLATPAEPAEGPAEGLDDSMGLFNFEQRIEISPLVIADPSLSGN